MTGKEIWEKLSSKGVSREAFAYNDIEEDEEIGPSKEVKQVGGEDEGSTWYSVQYFEKHDVYLRIDGYYSSYNGTDFYNDPYEVKPTEKTITVYE